MSRFRKYTDWATWWDGLRTNWIRCLGTTGTAWLMTNGLAETGIPGTHGVGIDYKQAIAFFAVHLAAEAFKYFTSNQPKTVIEECPTTITPKP